VKRTLSFIVGLVLLVGCSNFTRKAATATAKVEAAQKAEATLDAKKVGAAKTYVYGAGEALRNPVAGAPVASGLVRRAAQTLGPPTMEDAQTMDRIVSGLLSEEQTARKAAESRLAILDARVVGLERQLVAAQKVTERAEEKRDGVLGQAAVFADKHLAARRWVLLLVAGFLAIILLPPMLRIAALFAGGPLGGALASVAGSFASGITKAVPGALAKAGAVAAAEHAKLQKAFDAVVVSVERAKRADPGIKPVLRSILQDETSREVERPLIEASLARNKLRLES